MNLYEREEIYQQAMEWVIEAGERIRSQMDKPLSVYTKSNENDLVTAMDKNIEHFFTSHIKEAFPDHRIMSEEGYGDKLKSLEGTVWIIDPIDGTMNFVHQKRHFAISVGVYHDGIGEIGLIYDVMNDYIYHAKKNEGAFKNNYLLPRLKQNKQLEKTILGLNHSWLSPNHLVDEKIMQRLIKTIRGSRTYGAASLEFTAVAEGVLDGYMSMRLAPWDYAAGIIIVQETGGTTCDVFGEPLSLLETSSVLTANPAIQSYIVNEYMLKGRKH